MQSPSIPDLSRPVNFSIEKIKDSLEKINRYQIQRSSFEQIKIYSEELKKQRVEIIEGRLLGAANKEVEEAIQLFNQAIYLINEKLPASLIPLPPIQHLPSEILDKLLLFHPTYQNASSEEKMFIKSLTPKNLGHLFGDSFILGMVDRWGIPLEGNTPFQAIKFFLAALDYLPSKYPDAFKGRNEEVIELRRFLHQSLDIFSLIESAENEQNLVLKAEHTQAFVSKIRLKLETLQEGEGMLLPWGWSHPSGIGHAMLISVTQKRGNLILDVFNTGEGIQYHSQPASSKNNTGNPCSHYQISANQRQAFYTDTLQALFEPLILGGLKGIHSPMYKNTPYSAAELYLMLEPYRQTVSEAEWMKKMQESGTCSFQCLFAFMGKKIPGLHKELKFLWEQEATDHLLEYKDLFLGMDPVYEVYLSRLSPSLFRYLEKSQKNGLTPEESLSLLKRLERQKEEIATLAKNVQASNPALEIDSKPDWVDAKVGVAITTFKNEILERYPVEQTAKVPSEKERQEKIKSIEEEKAFLAPLFASAIGSLEPAELISSLKERNEFYKDKECARGEDEWKILGQTIPPNLFYIENCHQLSLFFVDPLYKEEKKCLLMKLKNQPTLLEPFINELSLLIDIIGVKLETRYYLTNLLALEGIRLAVFELGSLQDDQLGHQGPQRLDYYALQFSLSLEDPLMLTLFTFHSPHAEKEIEKIKQAYQETFSEKKAVLCHLNKMRYLSRSSFRFNYDRSFADFQYASHFVSTLSPKELEQAHEDYLYECKNCQRAMDIKEEDWLICHVYTHQKLPLAYQTIFNASLLTHIYSPLSSVIPHTYLDDRRIELGLDYNPMTHKQEEKLWISIHYSPQETPLHIENSQGLILQDAKVAYIKRDSPSNNEMPLYSLSQNAGLCAFRSQYKEIISMHSLSHAVHLTLLLDYYRQFPELLGQIEHQIFFESLLFPPYKLTQALQNNPLLAEELRHFFEEMKKRVLSKTIKLINKKEYALFQAFLLEQKVRIYQTLEVKGESVTKEWIEIRKEIEDLLKKEEKDPGFDSQGRLLFALISTYSASTIETFKCIEMLTYFQTAMQRLMISDKPKNMGFGPYLRASQMILDHLQEILTFIQSKESRSWIESLVPGQTVLTWKVEPFPLLALQTSKGTQLIQLFTGENFTDSKQLGLVPDHFLSNKKYQILFGEKRVAAEEYADLFYHVQQAARTYKIWGSSSWAYSIKNIEQIIEGERHFLMTPEELNLDFIPATQDWQLWLNQESTPARVLIYDKMGANRLGSISEEGIIELHSSSSCHYRYANTNQWNSPFIHLSKPFLITQIKDHKNQVTEEIKLNLKDEKGQAFEWVKKKNRWHLKQEPSYFIAADQKLVGMTFNHYYLILENRQGEKWALLPELSYTQLEDKNIATECAQKTPCSCLKIALKKNQEMTMQTSPYKNSFLAYHQLMQSKKPQDYLVVLAYLQGTQEFRPYEDEELKMLGMIVFSDIEKKNDDPEAFAIRLYAAYQLYDNLTHYPREKNQPPNSKDIQRPEPVSSALAWSQYIQEYFAQDLNNGHTENIVSSYLNKSHQLSNELKIEKLLPAYDLERWGFLALSSQEFQPFKISLSNRQLVLARSLNYQKMIRLFESNYYWSAKNHFPPFLTRSGQYFEDYFLHLFQLARSPNPEDRHLVSNFLQKRGFEIFENNKELFTLLLIALEAHNPQSSAHLTAQKCLELLKNPYIPTSTPLYISRVFIGHKNGAEDEFETAYEQFYKIYSAVTYSKESQPNFEGLRFSLFELFSRDNRSVLELPKTPPLLSLTYTIHPKLFNIFQEIAEKYFEKNEAIQEEPKEQFEGKNDAIKELNQEYRAGYQQNLAKKAVKTKRNPLEVKQKLLGEEQAKLVSQQKQDEEFLNTLSQKVIQIGNRPLKESIKGRTKIGNAKKKFLSLENLLLIALKNHPKAIQQATSLKEGEQAELLQAIGHYLEIEMRLRHTKALLVSLKELEKREAISLSSHLRAIQDLLETPYSLVQHSNPLIQLTFQHFIDLNFYPDQVAGLDQLIDLNQDCFLQRATGAGKTLVFAHSLAYYKADGYHLSLHVSPTYQFASQIYEMSERSKTALGQKARALVFYDRPEYFNVSYLQQLNQEIIQAIQAGDYFNTTIVTLRTLRAAYLYAALEYYHPSQNLTAEQKTTLALKKDLVRQINATIRSRGRLTFDEVQDAQNPKFILNKGVGESTYLDSVHIEMMSLMLKLGMESKEGEKEPLIDLKGNRQARATEENKAFLAEKIVTTLTHHKEWLKKWECEALSASELKELQSFLLKEKAPVPSWLKKRLERFSRSGNQMTGLDHLLLCRQLIAGGWLFDSLAKSVYEHHGIVYQDNRLPISIPFMANMKPSKNSEFSDPYRMGLNTLVAYHVQGLNGEQIKELIDYLRKTALKEFEEKSENDLSFRLNATKGWGQFSTWTEGITPVLSLFDCDLRDPELLLKLQKNLNRNDPICIDLLSEYVAVKVLKKKTLLTEQVACHAMNTATMGKSISGFSATIDNCHLAPTMDYQGRKVGVKTEKGIFGQRIDLLIQRHPFVYVMGNEPLDLFRDVYRQLPNEKRKNVRALIDTGCHFIGVRNEEVAKWMCIEMQDLPIKGVIFYDLETDRPYFMLKKNPSVIKPVPSFKTKTVNQVLIFEDLNLPVDQVAVYFNQDKTTGTNIPLMKGAVAISTVTAHTKFFSKIQGDGRLRQIENDQEVITAVQKAALIPMSHLLEKPEIKNFSEGLVNQPHFIKEIIRYTYLLRTAERKEENEIFCIQDLQNTVQQYLLDKIYEDCRLEPEIFTQCGTLFKEAIGIDFVRDHGLPKLRIEKEAYLDQMIEKLLAPLQTLKLPPEECKTLKKTLQALKTDFLADLDLFIWISPSALDPQQSFQSGQASDRIRVQVQEKQTIKVLDKLQVQEWVQEDLDYFLTPAASSPLTKEALYSTEFGTCLAKMNQPEDFEETSLDYGDILREVLPKITPLLSSESFSLIEAKGKEKLPNLGPDKMTAQEFLLLINIITSFCSPEQKASLDELLEPYQNQLNFNSFKLFNLEQILQSKFPQMWQSAIFSPDLLVTPNFVATAANGVNIQDELQKPIFQVLVMQDEHSKQTRTIILSSSDAEDIAKLFEKNEPFPKGRKMWLLRPQGDLAWPGPTPYKKEGLLQEREIRLLLTQVLFFAGHLSLLDQSFWQNALKEWLATIKSPAFAQAFFENSVLRYRSKEEYLFSKTRKTLRAFLKPVSGYS